MQLEELTLALFAEVLESEFTVDYEDDNPGHDLPSMEDLGLTLHNKPSFILQLSLLLYCISM